MKYFTLVLLPLAIYARVLPSGECQDFAARIDDRKVANGNENNEGIRVGDSNNHQHGIGGIVYVVDEKTLLIKGFTYDGAGPDAFFWVGTQGSPSGIGNILPYPFEGKFYEYEDKSAPILNGRFSGDKDIKLTLPDTLNATDIKWLSIWFRTFSVNFGYLIFPDNLSLHEYTLDTPTVLNTEREPESGLKAESSWNKSKLLKCTNFAILALALLSAIMT